ncbi:adhesion G-protein coupled receptor G2 [Elysia marginata]|uniref:Adhesion G-protein coupled receptor G2 n=1 Tax=Elysia marginata TaxID=1093978 RepID=A0AAV4HR42_9GAST|nr:adhesion G-protein coupled receptor G2 [Elysia marginata]
MFSTIENPSTVQRLRGAIGIVILLGLTWIFAIFAIGEASVVFYYLFAIFNSLQGLFIFIFYCVLKKDAMSAWKRVLPCFEEYGDSTKTSSNSRGASQSATNMNAVNVKYRAASASSLHGTATSSTTATSVVPDSRKASVTTMLDNGNTYHTIDDADIYTKAEYAKMSPVSSYPHGPPSYSVASTKPASTERGDFEQQPRQGIDNPATPRYPYSDEQPTAYSYRNGNVTPNQGRFSHGSQINRGMQPFGPAFSYSERQNELQYQYMPRARAEGEVDTSNMAKVSDIRLRYERTMSQTSDNHKTNI